MAIFVPQFLNSKGRHGLVAARTGVAGRWLARGGLMLPCSVTLRALDFTHPGLSLSLTSPQ